LFGHQIQAQLGTVTDRFAENLSAAKEVLVVLTVIFCGVAYKFFATEIVTTALRSGLEQANGATVDLE